MEHSEKNIDDHENFLHRHKACVDWLTKAQQQLDSCSDMVGDEDSLNVKLAIIEVGSSVCAVLVKGCVVFSCIVATLILWMGPH